MRKIILFFVPVLAVAQPGLQVVNTPAKFYGIQRDQAGMERKYDKLGIARQVAMRTDSSPAMLSVPPGLKVDFDIARTPPSIDFAIVQGFDPWYLPEPASIDSPLQASEGFAIYSGFGDVVSGPDGCFYFVIGNHRYYGGNAYVVKYDPVRRRQSIALETRKLAGWTDKDWSDGKVHGDPDIGPDGEMWLLTFSGPRPNAKDLELIPYKGAHLLRYNVLTGKSEDLGVPFSIDTWCYHTYDWERGVLFAVGQARGMLMIYDTRARRLLYAGFPPPEIHWYRRALLLDRDTGRIYTTDSPVDAAGDPSDKPQRLVYWERTNNKFALMKSETPPNPSHGKRSPLRAYTHRKSLDGAFWCFDYSGTLFKFFPREDRVEPYGVNWGEAGVYTANLSLSPKGRYLYYVPGAHSDAYKFGTPVVQFDTQTKRRKVLAFLNDFYLEKYGYSPYGAYGVELDKKGESLFFYANGQFTSKELGSGYGRPAIFHLRIPASERAE